MEIDLKKVFSQNDSRWKNDILGENGTIGGIGCLMTSVTMMLNWYGHSETPKTLNQKLIDSGGYLGNLFIWGVIPILFSDVMWGGLVNTIDPLTKTQMDFIRAKIDEGIPVILQIDTIPATSKLDEHWVLAVDYDGDDFMVADPWDGVVKRITSWGAKPQEVIYAYAYYKGKPAATTEKTITIPVKERDWLVGGATVRKQVAEYLEIADADNASFESIQRVIAGIKSSVTDYQTKWKTEEAERKNREEQVSRLKEQLTNEKSLRKELNKKLNEAITSVPTITKVYEDRILVMQGQIDTMGKEKGELNNQLKDCKLQNPIEKLSVSQVIEVLINKILRK